MARTAQRAPARAGVRGKVALITGATQGIGLAIARGLAAQGCAVVVTGRNPSRLDRVSRELAARARVLAMVCEVRDVESVQALCAAIKRQFGRVDILVNNAGVGHSNRKVADLSPETWHDVIATNLSGMFLVTHHALPLMGPGSAIVNNLSIAARRVFPGSSAYNASKHGALGFTNTLREELRPQGIRVIALLPGATDTALWNTVWPDAPRKKMMSARTVARAVVDALLVPPEGTVEELVILPRTGTL